MRFYRQLHAGLAEAFKWDRKVLIEKAVRAPRELEVSVLGNDVLEASAVGEIIPRRSFYDYTAKYFAQGDRNPGWLCQPTFPSRCRC